MYIKPIAPGFWKYSLFRTTGGVKEGIRTKWRRDGGEIPLFTARYLSTYRGMA